MWDRGENLFVIQMYNLQSKISVNQICGILQSIYKIFETAPSLPETMFMFRDDIALVQKS